MKCNKFRLTLLLAASSSFKVDCLPSSAQAGSVVEMRVEDISAVDDTLSTRICRLDIASDCGVVENAAVLLKNSSSELAIIIFAFMV